MATYIVVGDGFLGTNMTSHLESKGHKVININRKKHHYSDFSIGMDYNLFKSIGVSCIFHLVGSSYTDDWNKLIDGNARTTIDVLNTANMIGCKTVVVGSASEYGKVHDVDLPIEETHALNPMTPYGLSMKLRHDVVKYFANRQEVVYARLFNPIGKGVSKHSPIGGWLSEFEIGEVRCGNITMKRDFIDISDICEAFEALAKKGSFGEVYNVCYGKSYSFKEILDTMIANAPKKDCKVIIDEYKLKFSDMNDIYGCREKIRNDTGWEPKVSIEESIRRLFK